MPHRNGAALLELCLLGIVKQYGPAFCDAQKWCVTGARPGRLHLSGAHQSWQFSAILPRSLKTLCGAQVRFPMIYCAAAKADMLVRQLKAA